MRVLRLSKTLGVDLTPNHGRVKDGGVSESGAKRKATKMPKPEAEMEEDEIAHVDEGSSKKLKIETDSDGTMRSSILDDSNELGGKETLRGPPNTTISTTRSKPNLRELLISI